MSRGNIQRIRDPVHGLIMFGGGTDSAQNETDRIAWRLINTAEFQRLRRIRQLGFSDFVYPGATHSRFAHCIGVYDTARRLVSIIGRDRELDPAKVQVALLTSLLHDIGHGPYSHVFEAVSESAGIKKTHETWGAEIVLGKTEVNAVLADVNDALPQEVADLLRGENAKDIYATIVSSQFDADRLDYIQRDRLMTGVRFGKLDVDWLLDCLEVGSVTIEDGMIVEAPCFYINPKGIQVAEEYVLSRFRLYMMVYMHKTTRSAERMLEALLRMVSQRCQSEAKADDSEPVSSFFRTNDPSIESYLALDDAAMLAAIARFETTSTDSNVKMLAHRLRVRELYKCVDVPMHDEERVNLHLRYKKRLQEDETELWNVLLHDDVTVTGYKWFDFESESALEKVLVKQEATRDEPSDIFSVSPIVAALIPATRIFRVYAPDEEKRKRAKRILEDLK